MSVPGAWKPARYVLPAHRGVTGVCGWLIGSMAVGKAKREADLGRRETAVAAREAALADRMREAQAILDAADARDATADARDDAADSRESDLDRTQFLAPPDDRGYGADWPERRNAGLDREHAKQDRETSQDDRVALTKEADAEDGAHGG